MSERMAFVEALARVQAKIPSADAYHLLNEAIRLGRIEARQGPATSMRRALDWVPNLSDREIDNREIDRTSLDTWLDRIVSDARGDPLPANQNSTRQPHRPRGTGYADADAAIVAEMARLYPGQCASATEAAWAIVGRDGKGAKGTGAPESKVDRLVRLYGRTHRE
ncbi:hypothetical protein [Mesorhizobium sp. M0220]|uniref:hypothetical protein n=1 Tax=Mesorhizobium sp. M0220 TaxID=2956920 RepID=UPI00333C4F26